MNVKLVCMVPCVLQLEGGGIVSGYKTPVWTKLQSISELGSDSVQLL